MNEDYKENNNVCLEIYNFLNNKKLEFCNDTLNNNIIKKINELTKLLEEKIKNICNHEYEYDYIDISLDKSQKICYCKKCMLSF
jgi:hypothetical protein